MLLGLGNEANLRMNELGELLGFDHLSAVITRTGQFKRWETTITLPLGIEVRHGEKL